MNDSVDSDEAVCKIMDYSKYMYRLKKKEKQNKQIKIETKEIKFNPSIAERDILVKINNIERIIKDGYNVIVTVTYKGRQIKQIKEGVSILNAVKDKLSEKCLVVSLPKIDGNKVFMTVSPINK